MSTRPRRRSGSLHITSLVSRSGSGWDEVRPWLVTLPQRQRLLRLAIEHQSLLLNFTVEFSHYQNIFFSHSNLMRSKIWINTVMNGYLLVVNHIPEINAYIAL